jgi:hypothetical protein
MGPADRELMDEDDTQSFEALELRLKTPMRPVPKSRVGTNIPLKPVLKVDSRVGSKGSNKTCPLVLGSVLKKSVVNLRLILKSRIGFQGSHESHPVVVSRIQRVGKMTPGRPVP